MNMSLDELVRQSVYSNTPIDRIASEATLVSLKVRGLVVDILDSETGQKIPRVKPRVRHEILGISPLINWKEDWDGR